MLFVTFSCLVAAMAPEQPLMLACARTLVQLTVHCLPVSVELEKPMGLSVVFYWCSFEMSFHLKIVSAA